MSKKIPVTLELDLFELFAIINCAQLGASALADTDDPSYHAAVAKCAQHSMHAIDEIGGGAAWSALVVRVTDRANALIKEHGVETVRLKRDPRLQ